MKFAIETLGCKVNEYESQYYAQQLEKQGYEPVHLDDGPDICIINTCTVTNTAAAKSRQKINRAKKLNPDSVIVLVGCYAQSLSEEERSAMQADLIIGASHKKELPKLIDKFLAQHHKIDTVEDIRRFDDFEDMPISSFENQHRAFLKIEDGCNQFCTYCQIPYVRGRERSMPKDKAVQAAIQLAKMGHQEIVLTGIHTGRYADEGLKLADLLELLLQATPENVHFRISSIEITEVDDDLIALMAQNPRLCRHLHIPIQAASNPVLKRMARPYTVEEFARRLETIRKAIPDISVSTDVITGFVAESEEEFEEGKKNLEDLHFSFLHVFPYSRRDGTAAAAMKGQVHGSIVKERVSQLLDLSARLREQDMARFDQLSVLIEKKTPRGYTGYTSQYHPVCIESDEALEGRIETGYDQIEDGVYRVKRKGDQHASVQNV